MAKELSARDASKEDIQRGLELLAKEKDRKRRIASGEIKGGQTWGELSDEQKKARMLASKKREARRTLTCQKALEAGITVSDAEVDSYLSSKG